MAARYWNFARTAELGVVTAAALLSLIKNPFIPAAIILCAALLSAFLKTSIQIHDSRIRRCKDGVGLACGAFLPLALLPSLPQSARFAALSVSTTVVTTAWLGRRRATLALLFYISVCATLTIREARTVSHVLIASAVPFISDAQIRAHPQTFTVCESAIIAGAIAGFVTTIEDRLSHPEATIDAVTNAALLGALLIWLGLGDCRRTPKASFFRRMAVSFGCVGITYLYAWRIMETEPVLWVTYYMTADAKRWGIFAGWIGILGCAVIVLRPEQKVERVVARKYYHVLGMIIFSAGIACDEGLTRLGSAVGLCLMLFMEMGRIAGTPFVKRVVNEFFGRLVDEKDAGAIVVTHIYLLVGCAAPMWIDGGDSFKQGGILVVCCLDAIAAAVGRKWGRIEWPGTNRTIEGSLAGFVCTAGLGGMLGGGKAVIAASFAGAILEAVTEQIDNLVLPMAYCSIIGSLS